MIRLKDSSFLVILFVIWSQYNLPHLIVIIGYPGVIKNATFS